MFYRDKYGKNGVSNVTGNMLKYGEKEMDDMENETEMFNSIYKELCEIIGVDATMDLYWRFKGQQVCFPVRLYDPGLIREIVIKEFDGSNVTELAQKYDYSEKTIRRMLREEREGVIE